MWSQFVLPECKVMLG